MTIQSLSHEILKVKVDDSYIYPLLVVLLRSETSLQIQDAIYKHNTIASSNICSAPITNCQ